MAARPQLVRMWPARGGWETIIDVQRAISVLHGIAVGIAIDQAIRDEEVAALERWLHAYDELLAKAPFDEMRALVARLVEDRHIDELEIEELLEWCHAYLHDDSLALACATTAIRRLHGALHGVARDGVVTDEEARRLRGWLGDHAPLRALWPFNQVWRPLERVLADGRLDADEHVDLLEYCLDFSERLSPEPEPEREAGPEIAAERWRVSGAPMLQTLEGVCEKDPSIELPYRTFCFVGQASWGKRADLHGLVARRKGIFVTTIDASLDHLVVGARSQPGWAYCAYGRKIEEVMSHRRLGAATTIVTEADVLRAAGARSR